MNEEERWIRDCYVPPTLCDCGLQVHCFGYPCTAERREHFKQLSQLERWLFVMNEAALAEEDRKDQMEEANGLTR